MTAQDPAGVCVCVCVLTHMTTQDFTNGEGYYYVSVSNMTRRWAASYGVLSMSGP